LKYNLGNPILALPFTSPRTGVHAPGAVFTSPRAAKAAE